MSTSLFESLFADLAAPVLPATACESCDSCEDRAPAPPTAEFEHLRTVANSANASADSQDSQGFANHQNGPQALYSCGSSQNSQDSQGSPPKLTSSAGPTHGTYEKLIEAIRDCCAVRGDTDRNRDALLSEAGDYDTEAQLDLIAHFLSEAAIWRAVSASGHMPAPTPVARVPIHPVPSVKTCPQCANRLRFGTCGRPIEAGLIGADEGYGIVWAPPRWAATCRAFAAAGRGVV